MRGARGRSGNRARWGAGASTRPRRPTLADGRGQDSPEALVQPRALLALAVVLLGAALVSGLAVIAAGWLLITLLIG